MPMVLGLARAIGDENLATWVKLEVMGYHPENPAARQSVEVPEYRSVAGHWYDDYDRQFIVDDPRLSFINSYRLPHGVAELHSLATAAGPLSVRPLEFSEVIRKGLNVEVSVFRFRAGAVSQVIANIRLQLLERLAERREKLTALPEVQKPTESESLQLKPGMYGVSVDLKALWRQLFRLR